MFNFLIDVYVIFIVLFILYFVSIYVIVRYSYVDVIMIMLWIVDGFIGVICIICINAGIDTLIVSIVVVIVGVFNVNGGTDAWIICIVAIFVSIPIIFVLPTILIPNTV